MQRRNRKLTAERLESREYLAFDLAELNAGDWGVFASDNASASISDESARRVVGETGLRFETASGFDTGVRYPKNGNANWDLSQADYFTFLEYAENPNLYGFQGEQPKVVLKGDDGAFIYTPRHALVVENQWQRFSVPLDGNELWIKETLGTPSLSNIDQLEIHHDTWDYGFTIYLDGVRFESVDNRPSPPPPSGVDPLAIQPKVLLYVFDPVMENKGGMRQHEAYGWESPEALTDKVIQDFRTNSHGLVQYEIAERVIADMHPYFKDGFQHTDESFDFAWSARDFHPAEFDYPRLIAENDLASRIDQGDFDEVWIYAGPISGMWESAMAGEGAYWINGPTQPGGGQRAFPMMGWNFERGVGEAIHSWGHRAESTLDHMYRQWFGGGTSTWQQFRTIDRDSPGNGAVGNVHFPVNGQSDYDYDNPRSVLSTALDWENYPNLTGSKSLINRETWSPAGQDPQREYLNWWYGLMPHVAGEAPDGYLGNWWRYLTDINSFKGGNARTADGSNLADVTLTAESDSNSNVISFRADVIADGAIGRVDFYVDGIYRQSDTMAPFVFRIQNMWVGNHHVVAKAVELVNGWEFASDPVAIPVLPKPWNNGVIRFDVDSDLSVTPLDVLCLVNEINLHDIRQLPDTRPEGSPYFDVDNDGSISPLDVLAVVNHINSRGDGEGESEWTVVLDFTFEFDTGSPWQRRKRV